MGMIGVFRQLPPDVLDALRKDPDLIEVLDSREALDSLLDLHRQFGSEADFRRKMDRRPASFDRVPKSCDVDKAWQAIHYLLTKKAWSAPPPLGNVVLGGTPIGKDSGYGRARYLTPEEVSEVALTLATISPEELGRRFDADALVDADIYPGAWGMGNDDLHFIRVNYEGLRAYYADAQRQGYGMLLAIR
ncbi:MAG: YfbM family protein [Planctomycetes bacterium]|nr:YfbM family protein [Planctomycetota bacterium]